MMQDSGVASPGAGADVNALLSRVELLLALAEGLGAEGAVEQRDSSHRETVGRMLHWAARLRSEASAGASAMVEDAEKERARVAAEIELLRAERELCMTLAAEASSAVACHLTRWGSLEKHDNGSANIVAAMTGESNQRAGGKDGTRSGGGLADAEVNSGASQLVDAITLAFAAVPDVSTLMEVETALSRLPSVRACSARSVRGGDATMEVTLACATSALMIASEIVASSECRLVIDIVAAQYIAAHVK